MKPSKLDRGSSLVDALRQKYVKMDAPVEAPNGVFEHLAYTKRGNTKAIEFCGELKVRAEQQLDAGDARRRRTPTQEERPFFVWVGWSLSSGQGDAREGPKERATERAPSRSGARGRLDVDVDVDASSLARLSSLFLSERSSSDQATWTGRRCDARGSRASAS